MLSIPSAATQICCNPTFADRDLLPFNTTPMRIRVASIFVDDQDKALAFYTEKLRLVTKLDIPLGEYRWLTVRATDGGDTELLLEPNTHPAAKAFQEAIKADRIPATVLFSDDIHGEVEQLKARGVDFTDEPTEAGGVTIAVFDDTCGNLIQLVQD